MKQLDSDVSHIFKAYDIRGRVGSELTPALMKKVGAAFSSWLKEEGVVAIGYDMRPDSKELAESLMNGVISTGRDVINLGKITSDMAVFAVMKLEAAGAAVITASHNPGEYNGVKLYDNSPKTIGLDQGLDEIRNTALSSDVPDNAKTVGEINNIDISDQWIGFALSKVDTSLIPKAHIAIDAGNGMAGVVLPKVLKRLPQLEVEAMYFQPDGTFPNHLANPQDLATLKDLQSTIKERGLAFGIAFDGDGDRMAMVDETGTPIAGSQMFSLLAEKYVGSGDKFVHEVRTSRTVVDNLVKKTGGVPVRSKSGRSNIGEIMRREAAVFGGETTGHFFFKEYWDNDSGLLAMLIALEQIGKQPNKKLSGIINQHAGGFMIAETNFEVAAADAVIAAIAKTYQNANQDTLDGLSVDGEGWWFNIRKSNTEPLIRLNAEAVTQKELDKIIKTILAIVKPTKR